ncbi:unnamed protein product [Lupinus luteus]|uniref:Uncharacterized protein n=1 Tax=Lupinus luteus TaxID=3873 RepID=A0AAV1XSD7_LUPLU
MHLQLLHIHIPHQLRNQIFLVNPSTRFFQRATVLYLEPSCNATKIINNRINNYSFSTLMDFLLFEKKDSNEPLYTIHECGFSGIEENSCIFYIFWCCGAARRAAATASIPVFNAGDGPGQHPAQEKVVLAPPIKLRQEPIVACIQGPTACGT